MKFSVELRGAAGAMLAAFVLQAGAAAAGNDGDVISVYDDSQGIRAWVQVTGIERMTAAPFIAVHRRVIAERSRSAEAADLHVAAAPLARHGSGSRVAPAGVLAEGVSMASSAASGGLSVREAARAFKMLVRRAKVEEAPLAPPTMLAHAVRPEAGEPAGIFPPWRATDDARDGRDGRSIRDMEVPAPPAAREVTPETCDTCTIRAAHN